MVLKYPGAKNRIAKEIVRLIPKHDVYLEPFFGSGAVFFSKRTSRIETINDLDSDIFNYFNVLRRSPDALAERLRLTVYGRDEYEASYIVDENDDDIERARKFAVRCYMGFGASNRYKNGFRTSQRGTSPNTARLWKEFPENLYRASLRLKDAQIENLDALELIRRYDTKDVFIYLDPPYVPETRKGYLYRHEFDDSQHETLLQTVVGHPAKILLSGYESGLYEKHLKGWTVVRIRNQVESGLSRTECLYMNYRPDDMNIQQELF